jgi:hypothetical protein
MITQVTTLTGATPTPGVGHDADGNPAPDNIDLTPRPRCDCERAGYVHTNQCPHTPCHHLFRSATAIVAMCGAIDRDDKTDADQRRFADLPDDGTVCTDCIAAVRDMRGDA